NDMWQNLKLKSLFIVLLTAFAIWAIFPPFGIKDKEGRITKEGKIKLGLDLQGGMHLLMQVDTSKLDPRSAKDAADRAVEIIRNRIDQFGVTEPIIQKEGFDRILIQLPGITDRARAKEIIGKTAHLEFRIVADNPDLLKKAMDGEKVEGYELKTLKERDGRADSILVETKPALTGDLLTDATVSFSQETFGQPYVSLEFNKQGASIFSSVTAANVNKRLAIVLDGEVYTAPVIRERIPSGRAQITGNFSVQEAKDIAIVLRAGALPAPVSIIEERSVGPALGKDSIDKGMKATFIGAFLVVIFMIVYYLLAGLIANTALFVNICLLMAGLVCLKATWSLPGIAGLVLTVGMSVDANVLIYERIREELKLGKTLRGAIAAGFDRAFATILDSHVTTFITGALLFYFGTGPIKGFATVLCLGLITSMFTAIFITRLVLDLLTVSGKITSLPMLHIFGKTSTVSFIKMRFITYAFSLLIIIPGLITFFQRGEKMYSIDFTGGSIQQYKFKNAIPAQDLRKMLAEEGLSTSSIQQSEGGKEALIRTGSGEADKVVEVFNKEIGKDKYEVLRVENVGPAVGKDLRKIAIKSIIFAMIGILIYVAIRFEFRFAVTSIIALFHDVFMALGLVALTGREVSISVIAAVLTVVGYSISDTIVVLDRIRENRKFMRKGSLADIIDTSINQTLARTVLTSFTVFVVVVCLFLFGGTVINDFAFVMVIGVIFGTYSSIFVASPLLVDWPSGRKPVVNARKK
ncbi:MAG: protein translocase subunit SecD, partial [Candidatus Omnitrophica bacterium]|nr:protein translocase subunit SecD [Candidatus Omnitrophota bacterium]